MNAAAQHDLHTFMAQVSDELSSEYQRIYARAAQDPGTAGDEGEENWATILREWLPPYFHVETKGRLISFDGRMSPQVDVLVLKPAYPRKLRKKKVWLAGGVAAAFECKTTLKAKHLRESAKRAQDIKSTVEPRKGSYRVELCAPIVYGILAHSHSWQGENSDPIGNVGRQVEDGLSQLAHPALGVDIVCVADLATWTYQYTSSYGTQWARNPAELETQFGGPFGPMTSMLCSCGGSPGQQESFRPLGALIATLTQRLAWEDVSTRDIADYFRRSNLSGNASGTMRPWPLTIYSEEVRSRAASGYFTNGVAWDDWSISGP